MLEGFFFLLSIVRPFIYGAAIAFVLNIPMKAIEKSLFSKAKNPKVEKVKRPIMVDATVTVELTTLPNPF